MTATARRNVRREPIPNSPVGAFVLDKTLALAALSAALVSGTAQAAARDYIDIVGSAVGIFGFSFLDQSADKIHGALVDGKEPTFDNIADGAYPVSRPLYCFVNKAHVGAVPGILEHLAEFTSEKAYREAGYLSDRGLIPMPEAERGQFRYAANGLTPMGAL